MTFIGVLGWALIALGSSLAVISILVPFQGRRLILGAALALFGAAVLQTHSGKVAIPWPKHTTLLIECSLAQEPDDLKEAVENLLGNQSASVNLIWVTNYPEQDDCADAAEYTPVVRWDSDAGWEDLKDQGTRASETCLAESEVPLAWALCAARRSLGRLRPPAAWRAFEVVIITQAASTLTLRLSKEDFLSVVGHALGINAPIRHAVVGTQHTTFADLRAPFETFRHNDIQYQRASFHVRHPLLRDETRFKLHFQIRGPVADGSSNPCTYQTLVPDDYIPLPEGEKEDLPGLSMYDPGFWVYDFRVTDLIGHLKENPGAKDSAPTMCPGWFRISLKLCAYFAGGDCSHALDGGSTSEVLIFEDEMYLKQHDIPVVTVITTSSGKFKYSDSTWTLPPRTPTDLARFPWKQTGSPRDRTWHNPLDVTAGCWFPFPQIARSPSEVRDCLDRSAGLLLLELTEKELTQLNERHELEQRIAEQALSLLVVGPPAKNPPAWLPAVASAPVRRTDAELILVPDEGHLVRRIHKGYSGVRFQRDVIKQLLWHADMDSALTGCKRNEDFTLARSWHTRPEMPVWLQVASRRHRGQVRLLPAFKWAPPPKHARGIDHSLDFHEASHPWDRAALVLQSLPAEAQEIQYRNRLMVLFGAATRHVNANKIVQSSHKKRALSKFFAEGGRILVVEIEPAEPFDKKLYEDYLKAEGATDTARQLFRDWNASVMTLHTDMGQDPASVAQEIFDRFGEPFLKDRDAYLMRAEGPGFLFDRRINCVTGRKGAGSLTCNARVSDTNGQAPYQRSAPEWYQALALEANASMDRFGISRVLVGNDVIGLDQPFGLGRVHVLGYSPFARDFWERDLMIKVENTNPYTDDSCFWSEQGRDVYEFSDALTLSDGWGVQRLIDFWKLRQHRQIPREKHWESKVEWIQALPDKSALDLTLPLDHGESISTLATHSEAVSILLTRYDPLNRQATVRIVPKKRYSGELALQSTGSAEAILLPVDLVPAETQFVQDPVGRVSAMTGGSQYVEQPSIDAWHALSGLAALSLILCVSPLARQWNAFHDLAAGLLTRAGSVLLGQRRGSFFSLEAAINEWGANPGEPGTGRIAGLPAGLRTWQAGDHGSSILIESVYPLVQWDSDITGRKPKVRLRTLSQAFDGIFLLDDGGGLLRPQSGGQVSKVEFARDLTIFLVAATVLASGKASIRLRSSDALLYTCEGGSVDTTTVAPILQRALQRGNMYRPITRSLSNLAIANRIVFYVTDGASCDVEDIKQLLEYAESEGCSLRLVLITSSDDGHLAALTRENRTGAFFDRTEWSAQDAIDIRDSHVASIAHTVSNAGGRVAIFYSDMDEQSVADRIRETGLLA